MTKGQNLPPFVASQLEFAAHIRHPQLNELPTGIEARRMKIYVDLFYNNIEGFLAGAFPVCKRILASAHWDGMSWPDLVRSFVHRHGSESPYFLDISQEFLQFVSEGVVALPDWFLEFAHYEWVEMALAVADEALPEPVNDPAEDRLLVSPLAWPLSYRYPVHEIGPEHQPETVPAQATHLVVYRKRDFSVRFLASNPVTHALIARLAEGLRVSEAVKQLADELERPVSEVETGARATLARLLECEIVFNVRDEG